jgi:hypothetical protein
MCQKLILATHCEEIRQIISLARVGQENGITDLYNSFDHLPTAGTA